MSGFTQDTEVVNMHLNKSEKNSSENKPKGRHSSDNKIAKITALEHEVSRLKQREKDLEHDIIILKQVLKHIHDQFEEMKKQLLGR